jgi:hypothetical protein
MLRVVLCSSLIDIELYRNYFTDVLKSITCSALSLENRVYPGSPYLIFS